MRLVPQFGEGERVVASVAVLCDQLSVDLGEAGGGTPPETSNQITMRLGPFGVHRQVVARARRARPRSAQVLGRRPG